MDVSGKELSAMLRAPFLLCISDLNLGHSKVDNVAFSIVT